MAEAASNSEPGSDGLIPEHLRCTVGKYSTGRYLDIMDLMPDFEASGTLKIRIALELCRVECMWPITPDSFTLSPHFWKEPLCRHERPATLTTLVSILLHRIMKHSLTEFPKEMALWYQVAGLDLLECMLPLPETDGDVHGEDTPISHSIVAKVPSAVPKATPTPTAGSATPGPSGHRISAAGGGTKKPGSELQLHEPGPKRAKMQEGPPTLEALWDTVKDQQAILQDQLKAITKLGQHVGRFITATNTNLNTKLATIMAEAAKLRQEIKEDEEQFHQEMGRFSGRN